MLCLISFKRKLWSTKFHLINSPLTVKHSDQFCIYLMTLKETKRIILGKLSNWWANFGDLGGFAKCCVSLSSPCAFGLERQNENAKIKPYRANSDWRAFCKVWRVITPFCLRNFYMSTDFRVELPKHILKSDAMSYALHFRGKITKCQLHDLPEKRGRCSLCLARYWTVFADFRNVDFRGFQAGRLSGFRN